MSVFNQLLLTDLPPLSFAEKIFQDISSLKNIVLRSSEI